MCGFVGELRFDGQSPNIGVIGAMNSVITPRGPDSSGVWHRGPIALAHRRLKILDLSPSGNQPMVDEALGLSLVFNGCVYNFRDLRNELEALGHRFASSSDTEVILKGFREWGPACVERFQGMFAFAIYEHQSGRLTLARDRLGIKPLYHARDSKRVRFGSSLPALLAGGGLDTEIDRIALHHYMSFHSVVPAPHTILRGVSKLPAATVRTVEPDGEYRDRVYWHARFERTDRTSSMPGRGSSVSERDWEDLVLARLEQAVERRMVSDVPIGVLLSGGLDSSLIVALLARRGRRATTFSIGFESSGGESGDEFIYSDIIAHRFETDHRQIRIPNERLDPAIEKTIGAMSEPMVSHDCVAFYLLSEEVSKHVKVVQSGQGADEVFAGYSWYPPMTEVSRGDAAERYSQVFFDRSRSLLQEIVSPDWVVSEDVSRAFVEHHFAQPGASTALDAALRIDTTVMLVDDPVKRVDNMTMAWGLEGRVPFLDHDLLEVAAACPPELKIAQGGKGVLKNIGRRLLPHEIIDRPKGYFPVPAIRHLSGRTLSRVRDALSSASARKRGLFRGEYVDKLYEAPNAIRTNLDSNVLWQLGLLELWLQHYGI